MSLARNNLHCFKTIAALQLFLRQARSAGQTIGFVPTMGSLHAGHLSLIERARQENGVVVVSIFVNPLQFGPQEDLARYPRPWEDDRALCEQAGVNALFVPTVQALYGLGADQPGLPPHLTQVQPPQSLMSGLCGRSRPGHFQGVATVVTKLLSIVAPDKAYFGQKDAQQLAIIRQVVHDLNLPGEIVMCPIIRAPSGLALSSRNQYLSPIERDWAAHLYQGLLKAQLAFRAGERFSATLVQIVEAELEPIPGIQLDYVELVHPMTLETLEVVEDEALLALAAQVGSARLIDNLLLRSRQPIIALDGPAGAGKSTVARLVAQALGLLYLDTGAMYRAFTWFVLHAGVNPKDEPAVAELIGDCNIELHRAEDNRLLVWVNGQDVTTPIRTAAVTAQVSTVAAQAAVRKALVQQQQAYGHRGGIVVDGRDIGTHVFPDAELKIFMTASVQERARRRWLDLEALSQPLPDLAELERSIAQRDYQDSHRAIAPLRQAEDAIELNTDHLSVEEVLSKIVGLYRERLAAADR